MARADQVVLLALVLILIAGMTGLIIALLVKTGRTLRANLEHAARRLGGRMTRRFWKGDLLEWTVEGTPAHLRYFLGTDKAPPWTLIRFQWSPAGRLRVVPEGVFTRLRKILGAEDLRVGDEPFDRRYLVQGSPPSWVLEVLTPETRAGLDALWELGGSFWRGRGIRLDAGPAGVTLSCYRNLVYSRDELDAFIDRAHGILRGLQSRGRSGDGVLSAELAAATGRCPVCGHVLEEDLLRCRACTTLHHAECWTYFGGCAIYACSRGGGTRVLLQKKL
jgi:hypothetical protein